MTTIETIVPFGEGGASVARVECTIKPGVGVHLVGVCPPEAVKEVILRVATALQSCGYTVPGKKTDINIAPALPRGASVADAAALDLPVALAIIAESRGLDVRGDVLAAGELGLDGTLYDRSGIRETLGRAGESGLTGRNTAVVSPYSADSLEAAVRAALVQA